MITIAEVYVASSLLALTCILYHHVLSRWTWYANSLHPSSPAWMKLACIVLVLALSIATLLLLRWILNRIESSRHDSRYRHAAAKIIYGEAFDSDLLNNLLDSEGSEFASFLLGKIRESPDNIHVKRFNLIADILIEYFGHDPLEVAEIDQAIA